MGIFDPKYVRKLGYRGRTKVKNVDYSSWHHAVKLMKTASNRSGPELSVDTNHV